MKKQYITPEISVVEAMGRSGYMEEGVFAISYKKINNEDVAGKEFMYGDDDDDSGQGSSYNLWDD